MPSFLSSRLKILAKSFPSALIHSSDSSFYYLTDLPFSSWQSSFAVIQKNKITLLAKLPEDAPYEILTYQNKKQLKSLLLEFFPHGKIPSTISLSSLSLPTQNISKNLQKMREIKSEQEISRLKKSSNLAQSLLHEVPNLIKKGKTTEAQLANILEFKAKELSYETLAFPPIVASNPRTAYAHSFPSSRKISQGLLMVDFGLRYKNYCSDLTSMFFISSRKNLELYQTLENIKQCSEDFISESQTYKEAINKINNLYKKTFNKEIPHSFGHGIGIEVHDYPHGLSLKSKDTIQPNQTITIEPAYYTKNLGMRIEDDYLINNKGKPISYTKTEPIFF